MNNNRITISLPSDLAIYLDSKPNRSAYVAKLLRLDMLKDGVFEATSQDIAYSLNNIRHHLSRLS